MSSISENIQIVRENIAAALQGGDRAVLLVAATKMNDASRVREAIAAGVDGCGENRVQEFLEKDALGAYDGCPRHFIGHLQTNKVKYIAPYVSLIHAVDSMRLMEEIEKQAAKCERTIKVLLQLHVAQEETKYGLTIEECEAMLKSGAWKALNHIEIAGIMCMASNVDDEAQIAREFATAHKFFLHAKETYFADQPNFCECSMGMSDDYHIAIHEGSTLVRVGSKIFGQRVYAN